MALDDRAADLADQTANFLTAIEVTYHRDGDAFAFSLQGRDVLVSVGVGMLRMYVPLLEGIDAAEAAEAVALLAGAAPLPAEYGDVAAYVADQTSQTAGLDLLLPMPRTFSAPALGDACALVVEVADTLTRQAAGA